MKELSFSFKERLWLWKGESQVGGWTFITVPKKISQQIRQEKMGASVHGLGEVKAIIWIGPVKWNCKLFWSKNIEQHMFPVRAEIRKQLHITDGDEVHVDLLVYK